MTPYYTEPGIEIYHGNCRDVLPGLGKVDLVLTDPPYILSDAPPGDSHYGMSLRKFESSQYADLTNGFDLELFDLLPIDPFNLFCFCSNKQISDLMAWGERAKYVTTLLVWHKPNAAPFANGVWRGDAEFCIHIRQSGAHFEGGAEQKRKVTSHPTVRFDGHPTVKPLSLVRKYIEIGSAPGGVILDPYMGSGTTLTAAKDLGRKAIGIEIEERYCEIAVKRLRQEVLPI